MAFFKHARNGMIVFGRDDDDPVRLADRLRRSGHDRRESPCCCTIMIIERKLADRGQRLDRHAFRRERGRARAIAALNEPLRRLPTMTAK